MSEHLVTMVNEIASFFDSASGGEDAAKSVTVHLRRYWAPRMRKQIVEYMTRGGEGLVPIARAAIELLASEAAWPSSSS